MLCVRDGSQVGRAEEIGEEAFAAEQVSDGAGLDAKAEFRGGLGFGGGAKRIC